MTDDLMRKRRNAFAWHTGEKPPAEPKRWLVVWGTTGVDYGWDDWTDKEDAEADAAAATDEGFHDVKLHDLDAGW